MTGAEMFLMAWAVIATVMAVVYTNKFNNERHAKHVLMDGILGVVKGEAEVSLVGNRVTIKEKLNGDSTSE